MSLSFQYVICNFVICLKRKKTQKIMGSTQSRIDSEMNWFFFYFHRNMFCGYEIASWMMYLRVKFLLKATSFQELISQIFRRKTIIANYGPKKPIPSRLCDKVCVLDCWSSALSQVFCCSCHFRLVSRFDFFFFSVLTNISIVLFHCFFVQNKFFCVNSSNFTICTDLNANTLFSLENVFWNQILIY